MVGYLQGAIEVGKHADIVVWEPEKEFDLDENHTVHVKHPVCMSFPFFDIFWYTLTFKVKPFFN